MIDRLNHIGFALCEFNRAVVPLESSYANKADALRAAYDAVARETGCEVTDVRLFPASQHESALEAIDKAACDSSGYSVLPTVYLVPFSAKEQERAYAEHCTTPTDLRGLSASDAIALLAFWGYSARYSAGCNVWAQAPETETRLRNAGMRYSAKRGMWWIHTEEAGDARPQKCTAAHFAYSAA